MIGQDSLFIADAPSDGSGAQNELRALYDQLDAEVAHLGPICQLSGRCCRFREYGHKLFVSAIEVAFLLEGAPNPERPLDRGDTCPWQDSMGRCAARETRPLGCRVYYCDPAFQTASCELSERFLSRIKKLADRHGLPWNYAPLHFHLHAQRERGRLAIDLASADLS